MSKIAWNSGKLRNFGVFLGESVIFSRIAPFLSVNNVEDLAFSSNHWYAGPSNGNERTSWYLGGSCTPSYSAGAGIGRNSECSEVFQVPFSRRPTWRLPADKTSQTVYLLQWVCTCCRGRLFRGQRLWARASPTLSCPLCSSSSCVRCLLWVLDPVQFFLRAGEVLVCKASNN